MDILFDYWAWGSAGVIIVGSILLIIGVKKLKSYDFYIEKVEKTPKKPVEPPIEEPPPIEKPPAIETPPVLSMETKNLESEFEKIKSIKSEVDVIKEKLNAHTNIDANIKALASEIENLKKAVNLLEKKSDTKDALMAGSASAIEDIKNELKTVKNEINLIKTMPREAGQELKPLSHEIENIKRDIDSISGEIIKIKQTLDTSTTSMDETARLETSQRFEEILLQIEELRKAVSQTDTKKIDALANRVAALEQIFKDLEDPMKNFGG